MIAKAGIWVNFATPPSLHQGDGGKQVVKR